MRGFQAHTSMSWAGVAIADDLDRCPVNTETDTAIRCHLDTLLKPAT